MLVRAAPVAAVGEDLGGRLVGPRLVGPAGDRRRPGWRVERTASSPTIGEVGKPQVTVPCSGAGCAEGFATPASSTGSAVVVATVPRPGSSPAKRTHITSVPASVSPSIMVL